MRKKQRVMLAFLVAFLMVFASGTMAFANPVLDENIDQGKMVTSVEEQSGEGQITESQEFLNPSEGEGINEGLEGVEGGSEEMDLMPMVFLQQKGGGTSIHLKDNSAEGIIGAVVWFKDDSSITLVKDGNNWDALDQGMRVLDHISKLVVTFEDMGEVAYLYPQDFGPRGHGVKEPVEYSAEGQGSGSINLWLNKVKTVEEPDISLIKTVSPAAVTSKDAMVLYTFTVINDGNSNLTNVVLTDPLLNGLRIEIGSLAKGAEYTTSVAFNLSNLGSESWVEDTFTNIAQVVGTAGDKNVGDRDEAIVTFQPPGENPDPILSKAAISLKKEVSPSAVTSKEAVVTYTFTITNTGEIDLYGVWLQDIHIGEQNHHIGSLAVGETTTVAIDFNLSLLGTEGYGNWTGDTFLNTATVAGHHGEDGIVTDTDDAVITYSNGGGGGGGEDPDDPDDPRGPRDPRDPRDTPINVPDEEIPAGPAPEDVSELVALEDEAIPAGALPQTGGLDALLLYGLGALLTGGGVALRRKEKQ